MPQDWFCDRCLITGTVDCVDGDDVMNVVRALAEHHDKLTAKFNRPCAFDRYHVCVRNPELMDMYAWNRMISATIKSACKVGNSD